MADADTALGGTSMATGQRAQMATATTTGGTQRGPFQLKVEEDWNDPMREQKPLQQRYLASLAKKYKVTLPMNVDTLSRMQVSNLIEQIVLYFEKKQ